MIKKYIGAILLELPNFLLGMRPGKREDSIKPWILIRNRDENLQTINQSEGAACDWKWTTDLYLPKVFPIFGKWLLQRAIKDYPISFSENLHEKQIDGQPQVSFLIPHRGIERLPLLLLTLKSIAAQKDCLVECIIVEQDTEQRIIDYLPEWVRYIYAPSTDIDEPFSKARALNVAAQAARSKCLVFHDSDMLVPDVYAKHVLNYHSQGYGFTKLERFIFYLTEKHTRKILERKMLLCNQAPETIMQNASGGSFGTDKKAFLEIGGFDERFVGWGGEDNEFWERAQTKRVYPYGYLPFIHLWHEPQPGKIVDEVGSAKPLFWKLGKISVKERIKHLISMRLEK